MLKFYGDKSVKISAFTLWKNTFPMQLLWRKLHSNDWPDTTFSPVPPNKSSRWKKDYVENIFLPTTSSLLLKRRCRSIREPLWFFTPLYRVWCIARNISDSVRIELNNDSVLVQLTYYHTKPGANCRLVCIVCKNYFFITFKRKEK